ncbi:universal stress protein [Nocardia asteroides]|nr:universal stress protein [Nocardia asteroides]UGT51680.1 universal stress protein [Nocardia asteroides]
MGGPKYAAKGCSLSQATVVQPCSGPIQAVPALTSRAGAFTVVGSHGLSGLHRGTLGPTTSAVTGHAKCPVAVVHGITAADPVSLVRPVLVGVDGTPRQCARGGGARLRRGFPARGGSGGDACLRRCRRPADARSRDDHRYGRGRTLRRNCWWWAAAVAVDSPGCCSVRRARRCCARWRSR